MKQKELKVVKQSMKLVLPTHNEIKESVGILLQFENCSEEEKKRAEPVIINCVNNMIGTISDRIDSLQVSK